VGIALGLTAALSWGLADYVAALSSRDAGTLRVVLGFHVLATVILGLLCAGTEALDDVRWADVPPFIGIGALGAVSYLAFYRSLAIGPISIVSPIVSGYAAVTVVLAVIILGDRLSTGQILAVLVVMTGVVLASSDLARMRGIERAQALGLVLAIVATVAIGGFVFGIAYYAEDLGWLAPIFLGRAFTTVFIALALVRERQPFPREGRFLAAITILALVDTAGFIAFNFGIRHAETAVVATAAAPYAVVPIAMGVLLLRERPASIQWAGIAAVIGGVVLLGLVT
jgi:drug/metabolite transporter (DMT)-like permease